MPTFPTVLSTGTPFVRQGVGRIYLASSVANIASPTRAEMSTPIATDVSQNVTAMTAWQPNQNFANRSVFGSATVGTIAATANFPTQSMSFEAGQNSVDIRSLLVWTQPPATWWVLFLNEGDVPGQKMDVFKCAVGVVASQKVLGDTEAQIDVAFGVLDVRMAVTIPANP